MVDNNLLTIITLVCDLNGGNELDAVKVEEVISHDILEEKVPQVEEGSVHLSKPLDTTPIEFMPAFSEDWVNQSLVNLQAVGVEKKPDLMKTFIVQEDNSKFILTMENDMVIAFELVSESMAMELQVFFIIQFVLVVERSF